MKGQSNLFYTPLASRCWVYGKAFFPRRKKQSQNSTFWGKRGIWRNLSGLTLLSALSTFFIGCVSAPPTHQNNICSIFSQHPEWYWDAKKTEKRWGVPVSTQMAIMKQESHFVQNARPPSTGILPWEHPTSAYGYSQALNGTWEEYLKDNHLSDAKRTNFAYASDFIGWYAYQVNRQTGISPQNAYGLYLAYHEGIKAYEEKSYRKKHWLIDVARKVQLTKLQYDNQLRYCSGEIPKPSIF